MPIVSHFSCCPLLFNSLTLPLGLGPGQGAIPPARPSPPPLCRPYLPAQRSLVLSSSKEQAAFSTATVLSALT